MSFPALSYLIVFVQRAHRFPGVRQMVRNKTWALVMSEMRARILHGLDDAGSAPPVEIISRAPSKHLRNFLSDRSGRSLAALRRRSGTALKPEADPIRSDMQDFARETLAHLEQYLWSARLTRLAVFAVPGMLQILRTEMPATLRAAVCHESDENLIHLSEADLREWVLGSLNFTKEAL